MKVNNIKIEAILESATQHTWEAERLDDGLKKRSADVGFVEFDETGRYKQMHKAPKPGYAFIMSPFGPTYTWMTSVITEVMSFSKEHMQFKTKNSEYIVNKIDQNKMEVEIQRPPTFGEELVGLTFNPSGDPKVHRVKEICAELADMLDETARAKNLQMYPLSNAIYTNAIGEVLNAQMNVVKVLTLK